MVAALQSPVRFTLPFVPRTKKTSNRIVRVGKFHKVLPSEAFEEYQKLCVRHSLKLLPALRGLGVELPISSPVAIQATFFRDALRGDWCGYTQALGDVLQAIGVIQNDSQIQHFDGTRLAKDPVKPRTVVTVVPVAVDQQDLFSG